MPIAQDIANLFNGVSQQPPALRSPSQAEEQTNADAAIARGLSKRMGTRHVATLPVSIPAGNAHIHFIDRSPTDKWVAVFNGTSIAIFNAISGAAATVSFQDELGAPIAAPAYLTSSDAKNNFKCLSVGDYTFVVNRGVIVGTSNITTGGITMTEVQQFSNLPGAPVAGTIYKVLGSGGDQFTSYYVKGNAALNAYIECNDVRNYDILDLNTMPWAIVRTGALSFAFRRMNWAKPIVGDKVSNPLPSFAGTYIRDVFFYRNRLGFITSSGVALSRAGDYFNFFRHSMTVLADDDLIDAQLAHPKAPTLNHAATFNKTLILFGDTVQFSLEGGDILSPREVSAVPVAEFDCSQTARPVGLGPNVYFTQPTSTGTRVREFFVSKNKVSNDAFDVTAHCPNFVPSGAFQMVASSAENMLAVLTEGQQDALYVYRVTFDEAGEKRTQSCWGKWTFADLFNGRKLLGMGMSAAKLYLVFQCNDGVFLEHIDLLQPLTSVSTANGNLPIMLDRATVTAASSYDAGTDTTTWTLPYQVPTFEPVEVVVYFTGGGVMSQDGRRLITSRPTTTTVSASGDWVTSGAYFVAVGVPYTMRYRLSRIYLRDQNGNPQIGGRLQLRTLRVLFRDTSYFKLETTPLGRSMLTREWSADQIGVTSVGKAAIATGSARFTVNTNAEGVTLDLVNDSPYYSSFHGIQWEGEYATRSRKT